MESLPVSFDVKIPKVLQIKYSHFFSYQLLGPSQNASRTCKMRSFIQVIANENDFHDAQVYVSSHYVIGYTSGEIINISTAITLNSLQSIDELNSQVTFDLYLLFDWTDPRLSMPAFWNATNAPTRKYGVDISQASLVSDANGQQLQIWLPNILFSEAISFESSCFYLKVLPGGLIRWAQHIIVTLSQSEFKYYDYPGDTQVIKMRMYSFVLNYHQLNFVGPDSALGNELVSLSLGPDYATYGFLQNPIWNFSEAYATTGTLAFSSVYTPRSTVMVYVVLKRYPSGIVLRLAFPILLLVMLAAIAFWADPNDRINATTTMLLSVSALYIVVFQNVPMIGYLTMFDKFVVFMFIIMFVCCLLHQWIIRLMKDGKLEKWPLRSLLIRVLELIGRLGVIPVITALYLFHFAEVFEPANLIVAWLAVASFIGVVAFREVGAVRKVYKATMKQIDEKFEALKDFSDAEALVFNLLHYGIVSRSISHHMKVIAQRSSARKSARFSRHQSEGDATGIEMSEQEGATDNPLATSRPRFSREEENAASL